MNGFSIKEVAEKLNVSDKAIYKRISNENFNTDFITKSDGKTIITEEGLNYLSAVVKKKGTSKNEVEDEVAVTLADEEKAISKLEDDSTGTRIKVYTPSEIEIMSILREHIDFLKGQLEQQNSNFQEQLKLQAESYEESLKIQLETIKSKEVIILNMQDIIKSEQENTKKLLDYEERAREVDEKLYQIRKELIGRRSKHRRGLFSFFK